MTSSLLITRPRIADNPLRKLPPAECLPIGRPFVFNSLQHVEVPTNGLLLDDLPCIDQATRQAIRFFQRGLRRGAEEH